MVANVTDRTSTSAHGAPTGPGTATVLDHVIQELTPAGAVVWSWDTADHISVAETDPQWRPQLTMAPYDAYHWNSIEATDTGYIVSFRHLDAVFDIDKATGDITWKLGGSTDAAEHDHHERSCLHGRQPLRRSTRRPSARRRHRDALRRRNQPRPLRRVPCATRSTPALRHRHAWSSNRRDASLVPASVCCGSARRLDGGDWVVGWGGTNTVSEMTSSGSRVFLMQFAPGTIYRALPVPFGVLDRAALRAGMDAQYP